MTRPLDLAPIQARAERSVGRLRDDYMALIAEIRQLRTELAGMTDLKDRALTKQDTIRAELEQYTALDLGAPDGRVSATCDTSEHPTWLRKPDDTRGCPWCELDQTRKQSESWPAHFGTPHASMGDAIGNAMAHNARLAARAQAAEFGCEVCTKPITAYPCWFCDHMPA